MIICGISVGTLTISMLILTMAIIEGAANIESSKFYKKLIKLFEKKEKYTDYPTKEEFEKNIKRINEKELNSNKFKMTKKFISLLNKRKNLELEKQLF